MLYDPSTREALRSWLVKTLEPICDAEPGALADYVLALLVHEAPEAELRKEFISQLQEFLEKGAADFVDQLFSALRSKSYVPYSDSQHLDTGIPIPLDAFLSSPQSQSPPRGRKRNLEQDDDGRGSLKGARTDDSHFGGRMPPTEPAGSSRRGEPIPSGADYPMGSGYVNGINGHGLRGVERDPYYGPGRSSPYVFERLPKGVCRDYHIKGYCARGEMCKYSHDNAAFSPAQLPFPPGMAPPMPMPGFMPMFNNGMMPFGMPGAPGADPSSAYDPNEAHMDMRGPRSMTNAPGPSVDGESRRIPRPEDTTMHDASGAYASGDRQHGGPSNVNVDGTGPSLNGHANNAIGETMDDQSYPSAPHGGRGSFRGRRAGRGTFQAEHSNFRPEQRDNKTLVVEKIPQEHLSLEGVNGWFKRFGTVTNVAVDIPGSKALVSFSSHDEARAAWKAEEAVFNNRFVKIFWHRPMEGQGSFGQKMLRASAPAVANMVSKTPPDSASGIAGPSVSKPLPATPSSSESHSATKPSNIASLAAKQQLLEKQIAEQKALMGRLASATAEEKKEIMGRLRKLNDEMKTSTSTAAVPPPSKPHTPPADKEQRRKELLDMELDMHAKTTDSPAAESEVAEGDTEALKAKLAKLRAEADALGITDMPTPTRGSYRGGYRPYAPRSRGRGRASWRGGMRGGPPRASMKLDNRSRQLAIKGVNTKDDDLVAAVRNWYESSGSMESLTVLDDDTVVATFPNVPVAEQALSKGVNIPSVGVVNIQWHDPSSQKALPAGLRDSPAVESKPPSEVGPVENRPSSPRPDEIPESTGWGDGEGDGMGMF